MDASVVERLVRSTNEHRRRGIRCALVLLAGAVVLAWCSHASALAAPALASQASPTFAAGGAHSLAIEADGSLWAWGWNGVGQLGDGTTADRYSPTRVGMGTSWIAVAAGGEHSLAIKSDGSLWAWGDDEYGQLGDGSNADRDVPVRVGTGTKWVTVAAGWYSSLAIKSDGSLWTWGRNDKGQLGDGTTTDRDVPTRIGTDTDWVAIAAGGHHSLALKSDGSLWAWGGNEKGELGDGTTTDQHAPIRIGTATGWVAIATGMQHSVALKANGSLWAWGDNEKGQLGDGTTTEQHAPTRIGTENDWVAVSAGAVDSLALKSDGSLWAWGFNQYGQLGDGSTADRYAPTRVATPKGWVAVAGGAYHCLAEKSGGTLWAWGDNPKGALGDGTTTERDAPFQVLTGVKVPASGGTGAAFSDIASSPYEKAIEALAAAGIVTGFPDDTFHPDDPVTRQQFAKMIVKTMGYQVTASEVCPFTDVAAQVGTDPLYPSKYVAVCADHGITKGKTPTTFAPGDNITREQLITMVVRAAGFPDPPKSYTVEFSASQFSAEEHYLNARTAYYREILSGLEGVGPAYDFRAPASRGECAQMLYQLL